MRLGAAGLVSAREQVVVVLTEDGSVLRGGERGGHKGGGHTKEGGEWGWGGWGGGGQGEEGERNERGGLNLHVEFVLILEGGGRDDGVGGVREERVYYLGPCGKSRRSPR